MLIDIMMNKYKIHFGGQANLFAGGLRQTKTALSTDKADLSFLSPNKNFLLAAQKQLLELPLTFLPFFLNMLSLYPILNF